MPPPKASSTAAPAIRRGFEVDIKTPNDLTLLAGILYRGGGCNLEGVSSPDHVARLILAGNEVGLSPAQSLDTIMLCNGKATIYGDGAMALVMNSGLLAKIKEWIEGEGDNMVAKATIQRKDMEEETFAFSASDAKLMGLWNNPKKGNWTKDPKGMLTWRCRSRWQRGRFADVLRGLNLYEVAQDDTFTPSAPAPAVTVVSSTVEGGQPIPASLPPADPNGPIGDDQLNEIKFIKERWATAIGAIDPDQQRSKWVELLGTYEVKSAREFTRAKAAAFIEAEGKKYDPFGHPSPDSKT
jgi:hypothetical protein